MKGFFPGLATILTSYPASGEPALQFNNAPPSDVTSEVTDLPDGIFEELNNLGNLNLSSNSIKNISEFVFSPLNFSQFCEVDISNNPLTQDSITILSQQLAGRVRL